MTVGPTKVTKVTDLWAWKSRAESDRRPGCEMLEGVWEAGIGLCGLRAEVLGRELTPFHFHLISILFIEVGLTKFRGLLSPSPT